MVNAQNDQHLVEQKLVSFVVIPFLAVEDAWFTWKTWPFKATNLYLYILIKHVTVDIIL